jgi:hypothetical protein
VFRRRPSADPFVQRVSAVPDLPPGTFVAPAHQRSLGSVLWISDQPARPGDWARLAALHPETGLWPLLLEGLREDDVRRPWLDGEFTTPADWNPQPLDLERHLRERYEGNFEDEEEYPDGPEPAWPGSSPALPPVADPLRQAADIADELLVHGPHRHLGLVRAAAGADVLGALGWLGATNSDTGPSELSAVLRSWEERFALRVVGLGFDTLQVSVAAPPVTLEQALPVAAEHLAFCSDQIVQEGPDDVAAWAQEIVEVRAWRFWWD